MNRSDTRHEPFVSIVMPVRNEADFIERSLDAVLSQDYPPTSLEVIVADGGSTDATPALVASMIDRRGVTGPEVRVIDNPGGIVPTGLNEALRVARGHVFVRVDGHCVVAPDYVRRCVEALERTGADNVGGAQRAVGEGYVGTAVALAVSTPFGTGSAHYRHPEREGWVETVYLGAYRREVFDRIGGFDEELVRTQDGELNHRLIQSGGKIWLEPSIHVTYHGRRTLRSLWRQYFEYGFFKVRLMQKRRGIPALRQVVPPAFVLGLISSGIAAIAAKAPLFSLVVLIPYAALDVCVSVWTARRVVAVLPVLPVVFATIHLAWGLGFIWGLWRWRHGFRRTPRAVRPAPRLW